MGSLALRPGGSLTILLDGFVNRLQDFQFPSFLLFKLRGFELLPRWDFHPLFMPAFAGRTLFGPNLEPGPRLSRQQSFAISRPTGASQGLGLHRSSVLTSALHSVRIPAIGQTRPLGREGWRNGSLHPLLSCAAHAP